MGIKEEILNIDYHVKRMVLKALNKCHSGVAASKLLGVSTRTLTRYKIQYGIRYDTLTKEFFIDSKDGNIYQLKNTG